MKVTANLSLLFWVVRLTFLAFFYSGKRRREHRWNDGDGGGGAKSASHHPPDGLAGCHLPDGKVAARPPSSTRSRAAAGRQSDANARRVVAVSAGRYGCLWCYLMWHSEFMALKSHEDRNCVFVRFFLNYLRTIIYEIQSLNAFRID